MSTITDDRAAAVPRSASPWSIDRLLAWRPTLTAEMALYGTIFVVAVLLRFWDLGARAMHHDESLHATYSWYLYKGRGYEHHPLMHGPLLFHLMAAVYVLFGVSDATARYVPAAWGAALVLLPLLLRPWLGRVGALAAAALLAISPTLLYFSRFVGAGAQDILVAVGMMLVVVGVWHWRATAAPRWIYVLSLGLVIGYTTKEVTYMLAAIVLLYLNGVAAAELAEQQAEAYSWRPVKRRVMATAWNLGAWAVMLFWPWTAGPRERLRLTRFPSVGGPFIVTATLSAPMFSAAVQLPLEKIGVSMAAPAPFGDWTNEQFWGAITIGGLIALGAYFGTAWRRNTWLIAAAIFWLISVPLFTTFFTNPKGFATGVWGSLDYWLQQQDVRRGTQPVQYYLTITPVYEYLTLALMLGGVLYRALRTGRDTMLAALIAVVAGVAGAWLGKGGHLALPFVVLSLLAATYALRGSPFAQFLAFWLGAMFIGLSASGEKMPWLEVHLALPMALLAAVSIGEAVVPVQRLPMPRVGRSLVMPDWTLPVIGLGAIGLVAAALALTSDRFAGANPALVLVLVAGVAAVIWLAGRRHPAAALAAVALTVGLAGPLTVRTAKTAAYTNGDTPKEILVYTQSSPELKAVVDQVYAYARQSGMGYDTPVIVDSTEAFTWPWAWYLRDFRKVNYPELAGYRNNPSLMASLQPGSILLAEIANADIGASRDDIYGPGQRYKHRWWFPEDSYRATTTASFFSDVLDAHFWSTVGRFFLHRTLTSPMGSIDAVAYFPPDWANSHNSVLAQPLPEPAVEASGRLVMGAVGVGRGQFQRPAGVATDADGNVYVADSLNNRVQKLSPEGRLLGATTSPVGLREPWGVAVGRTGDVFVADTWNHRIVRLDHDLNLLSSWGGPPAVGHEANPSPLELYGPRAIAVDAAGNLWVTDTGHGRVVKFSPDGRALGVYGSTGTGQGQFEEPVGIAITPSGDVLVVDTWNGRVQRFDASFVYKGEFAVEGWSDRGIENKPYIGTGPDGSVFVTVPDGARVLRFSNDGLPLGAVGGVGDGGSDAPRPVGVSVDRAGSIWVTDAATGRVIRLPR